MQSEVSLKSNNAIIVCGERKWSQTRWQHYCPICYYLICTVEW